MKQLKFVVGCCLLLSMTPLCAQETITLHLPDTVVNNGDTLLLDIRARSFSQIVSVQFSLAWNPDVIRFVSTEPEEGLPFIAVGTNNAAMGSLRVSWFDIQGSGQTRPDNSTILRLKFFANGNPGDITDVRITDMPLAIQVFRATGVSNNFEKVDVTLQNGRVAIAGALATLFEVNDVQCTGEQNGAILTTIVGLPDDATLGWAGPNNFQSQQANIAGLAAGNYTFEIRDAAGGLLFDSTLTVAQAPVVLQIDSIVVMAADCATPTGTARAVVSGGVLPYRFRLDGADFVANNEFTELAAGDYALAVQDANGCERSADFTIVAADAPVLNLPDTVVLCEGENVLLDAGDFTTYVWSTGATTRTITVAQPGAYSITVSEGTECTASGTIRVVSGEEIEAGIRAAAASVCPGESLQLTAFGGDMFQWRDTSGTLSALDIANPLANPRSLTTYTVTISNGCTSAEASIDIGVFEITSSAGQDTCVGPGVELQLNASGGVEYFWFLSDYPVSNNRIPNPTTTPEDSTAYFVMITDANGCINLDTVFVAVASNPLDIPAINIITPNGDGANDTLFFGDISKYGANELKIYNRWGDLIYQKLNYQNDSERFDGTYKGKPLPAGNYFYVLAFRNGEIKQTLTILRE